MASNNNKKEPENRAYKQARVVLNLVKNSEKELDSVFAELKYAVLDKIPADRNSHVDFILVNSNSDSFESLVETMETVKRNIPIISLEQVLDNEVFHHCNGRGQFNLEMLKYNLGKQVVKNYFASNFYLSLNDNFPGFFQKIFDLKLSNHLRAGYYADLIATQVAEQKFPYYQLRTYFIDMVYFITSLRQGGIGELPIDIEWGCNESGLVLQMSISVDNFVMEYLSQAMGEINRDPSVSFLTHSFLNCDHVDLVYVEQASKLVVCSIWLPERERQYLQYSSYCLSNISNSGQIKEKYLTEFTPPDHEVFENKHTPESENKLGDFIRLINLPVNLETPAYFQDNFKDAVEVYDFIVSKIDGETKEKGETVTLNEMDELLENAPLEKGVLEQFIGNRDKKFLAEALVDSSLIDDLRSKVKIEPAPEPEPEEEVTVVSGDEPEEEVTTVVSGGEEEEEEVNVIKGSKEEEGKTVTVVSGGEEESGGGFNVVSSLNGLASKNEKKLMGQLKQKETIIENLQKNIEYLNNKVNASTQTVRSIESASSEADRISVQSNREIDSEIQKKLNSIKDSMKVRGEFIEKLEPGVALVEEECDFVKELILNGIKSEKDNVLSEKDFKKLDAQKQALEISMGRELEKSQFATKSAEENLKRTREGNERALKAKDKEFEKLCKKFDRLAQEKNSSNPELVKKVTSLEQEREQTSDVIKNLKIKMTNLAHKVESVKDLKFTDKDMQEVKGKINGFASKVKERDEEIKIMNKQVEKLSEDLVKARKDMENVKDSSEVQKKLTVAENELYQSKMKIKENETKIKMLSTRLEKGGGGSNDNKNTEDAAKLQKKLTQQESMVSKLNMAIEGLKKQNADSKKDATKHKSEVSTLNNKIAQLEKENAKLKAKEESEEGEEKDKKADAA